MIPNILMSLSLKFEFKQAIPVKVTAIFMFSPYLGL